MLRSRKLLGDQGFSQHHFRSTSSSTDARRGFQDFVFFGVSPEIKLLKAKLERGFPHYLIEVPTSQIAQRTFFLSKRNIAKSRNFRGAKQEPIIDRTCESYWGNLLLPVAGSDQQKRAMLHKFRDVEVMVEGRIDLRSGVRLLAFSREDQSALESISRTVGSAFRVVLQPDEKYVRHPKHVEEIEQFIKTALADRNWRGDQLDFDDLKRQNK